MVTLNFHIHHVPTIIQSVSKYQNLYLSLNQNMSKLVTFNKFSFDFQAGRKAVSTNYQKPAKIAVINAISIPPLPPKSLHCTGSTGWLVFTGIAWFPWVSISITYSWHQKTKPRILQFTNSRIQSAAKCL